MRTLTPLRRKAVLLSSCAAIFATMPVLLLDHGHGRGHDFFFGLAAGIALPLLVAAVVVLRRDRGACA